MSKKQQGSSTNCNEVKCSLERKRRKGGGFYLTCKTVHCDGTCLPYVVQGDDGRIDEIGCECVSDGDLSTVADIAPVTKLSGTPQQIREHTRKLPKVPVGDGRCQLVRLDVGGRSLAICKGSCAHGDCRTIITLDAHDNLTICCDCS